MNSIGDTISPSRQRRLLLQRGFHPIPEADARLHGGARSGLRFGEFGRVARDQIIDHAQRERGVEIFVEVDVAFEVEVEGRRGFGVDAQQWI